MDEGHLLKVELTDLIEEDYNKLLGLIKDKENIYDVIHIECVGVGTGRTSTNAETVCLYRKPIVIINTGSNWGQYFAQKLGEFMVEIYSRKK